MRRNTPKRAKQERLYARMRVEFLEANPQCEMCGHRAQQVHHRKGRVGALLTDPEFWAPVCARCHDAITNHPHWAIESGYSLSRVGTA